MKRKMILLAVLLSCLGTFVGSRPGLAAEGTATTGDPFIHMIQEGWRMVAPGVLQRDLGTGKVETFGLGAEGLRFKMEGMKAHLRDLRAELRLRPTPELRVAVRSYRAEIEKIRQALKTATAVDELESVSEKVAAGIDCTIKYGAHVDAYALTTSQGVGAKADSYFNSNCGQLGEVYAHATGNATGADGVVRQATKTDPATGIRSGGNVSATATITVNGVSACSSYAYASMTSFDLGIVYEQSVQNSTCPVPPPPPLGLTVSKSYAHPTLHIYGYDCYSVTWTASVSGGSSPFTYAWKLNGATVGGNSSTYTKQFCGQDQETTYTANVSVTVTDSAAQTKTATSSQAIAYHMTL
jgi:hypothetical protein